VLLVVPLVLPALVNLAIPYRITPDWTFPNWALLPVILYGSFYLNVDERAVARAGVVVLTIIVAILMVSPIIAAVRLTNGPDQYRPHFRQAADLAERLSGRPVRLFWGSAGIVGGMDLYMPDAQRLLVDPLSDAGRAATSSHGLAVICLIGDPPCQRIGEELAKAGARTTTAALTRSFLGFSSRPLNVQITVVPAPAGAA
jgi:hypothetical protein